MVGVATIVAFEVDYNGRIRVAFSVHRRQGGSTGRQSRSAVIVGSLVGAWKRNPLFFPPPFTAGRQPAEVDLDEQGPESFSKEIVGNYVDGGVENHKEIANFVQDYPGKRLVFIQNMQAPEHVTY